ncbi:MAG: hypothetical protein ING66_06540 [Rhodocyclaceae bacterium]|nr:hypothetical protein [Rhodocyclaceae bacterium]MCA3084199.1 hypothetical protein [Rhodocyclaceae bacterium]
MGNLIRYKSPGFLLGVGTILFAVILMILDLPSFGLHMLLIFIGAGLLDYSSNKK